MRITQEWDKAARIAATESAHTVAEHITAQYTKDPVSFADQSRAIQGLLDNMNPEQVMMTIWGADVQLVRDGGSCRSGEAVLELAAEALDALVENLLSQHGYYSSPDHGSGIYTRTKSDDVE